MKRVDIGAVPSSLSRNIGGIAASGSSAVRAGEQQRLGVGGREERRVDRHRAAQRGQHLPLHLGDVQAAATDAQDRPFGVLADVGHGSSVAAAVPCEKPHIVGMARGRPRPDPSRHDHRSAHPQQAPRRELHPGALHQGRPHGRRPLPRPRLRQPRPAVSRRARGRRGHAPGRASRSGPRCPTGAATSTTTSPRATSSSNTSHASGTRTGELFGAPGDGKTLILRGIHIFRVADDKIVERWGRLDEIGLLRQLGLCPPDRSQGESLDGSPPSSGKYCVMYYSACRWPPTSSSSAPEWSAPPARCRRPGGAAGRGRRPWAGRRRDDRRGGGQPAGVGQGARSRTRPGAAVPPAVDRDRRARRIGDRAGSSSSQGRPRRRRHPAGAARARRAGGRPAFRRGRGRRGPGAADLAQHEPQPRPGPRGRRALPAGRPGAADARRRPAAAGRPAPRRPRAHRRPRHRDAPRRRARCVGVRTAPGTSRPAP